MKYQSLYGYYWFGTCLRFLQDAQASQPIHGNGELYENLIALFVKLEEINLPVTLRLAHRKLDPLVKELRGQADDAELTSDQAVSLREHICTIREALEAEIEGVGAYTLTPKRLDLKKLVEDVSSLFAPNVFNHLPDVARYDMAEAGKCIAFEVPTAAAFHLLRATEDCLRFYYLKMIRSGRIKNLNWGPIVVDLRKRSLTKKYEPLNNHLNHIRDSFRNPTQHPESIYDIHEVQDLWAVCGDVVNRMIGILIENERI